MCIALDYTIRIESLYIHELHDAVYGQDRREVGIWNYAWVGG